MDTGAVIVVVVVFVIVFTFTLSITSLTNRKKQNQREKSANEFETWFDDQHEKENLDIVCRFCLKEIPGSAKFCPFCGTITSD